MEDAAVKGRAELWLEIHARKTQCPECGKVMSVRTLRWKHCCKARQREKRVAVLSDEQAEARRLELEGMAMQSLHKRLRERQAE